MARRRSREHLVHNWKKNVAWFLSRVLNQNGWSSCWAIAMIRQLEYLCKQAGLLAPDGALSVQHLLDLVPNQFMGPNFLITNLAGVPPSLLQGVVEESVCPLTHDNFPAPPLNFVNFPKYSAFRIAFRRVENFGGNYDKFEDALLNQLEEGPVAAAVFVTDSMKAFRGKRLYSPDPTEVFHAHGHFMLVTAYGFDRKKRPFFRCQDSFSRQWGNNGYIDVAAGRALFWCYVVMENAWFWQ